MGRLLTRAFGSVFVMVIMALLVTARHPVGVAAAPAADVAVHSGSNPWSDSPAPAGVNAPPTPKVIARDYSGQFHIDGFVNNRQTSFLVDTGADLVAIPVREAERLGLKVQDSDFRPMLQTASGTADGARVTLDRLDVAGTTLTHVPAVVVRGLELNLLGQSALKRLGKVTLRGDTMVIEPI